MRPRLSGTTCTGRRCTGDQLVVRTPTTPAQLLPWTPCGGADGCMPVPGGTEDEKLTPWRSQLTPTGQAGRSSPASRSRPTLAASLPNSKTTEDGPSTGRSGAPPKALTGEASKRSQHCGLSASTATPDRRRPSTCRAKSAGSYRRTVLSRAEIRAHCGVDGLSAVFRTVRRPIGSGGTVRLSLSTVSRRAARPTVSYVARGPLLEKRVLAGVAELLTLSSRVRS